MQEDSDPKHSAESIQDFVTGNKGGFQTGWVNHQTLNQLNKSISPADLIQNPLNNMRRHAKNRVATDSTNSDHALKTTQILSLKNKDARSSHMQIMLPNKERDGILTLRGREVHKSLPLYLGFGPKQHTHTLTHPLSL